MIRIMDIIIIYRFSESYSYSMINVWEGVVFGVIIIFYCDKFVVFGYIVSFFFLDVFFSYCGERRYGNGLLDLGGY